MTTIYTQNLTINRIKKMIKIGLVNNDLNITDIIMKYLIGKCGFCNDVFLTDDLEKVDYPTGLTHYVIVINDDTHESMEKPFLCDSKKSDKEYFCEDCKEENVCAGCQKFCCEGCDNRRHCDSKYCGNVFCEDCQDDYMTWCSKCENATCCQDIYKFTDNDGQINFNCQGCVEIITPSF